MFVYLVGGSRFQRKTHTCTICVLMNTSFGVYSFAHPKSYVYKLKYFYE